ncbi:hypothetical protein K432DRAFT_396603, partial [Lepidopterella palustris CBS 459.81]
GRRDQLAVRREGDGGDAGGMALKHAAARPRCCLLHPHCLVVRGRRDQLAVRREGDGGDDEGMALKYAAAQPRRRLLHPYCLVPRGRRDQLAVRREGDGRDAGEADATSWPFGEKATAKTNK